MPSLAIAKAANASTKLGFKPVALFVGGTSGIGQATAQAFARYTRGNAHIIICGRNEDAANQTIASFPKTSDSQYQFLRCDAAKLKNVATACDALKNEYNLTKLNYLVLSPGYFAPKAPFFDNGEGIDELAALSLYSRFKFITELLPLLQSAKDAGEEARVLTVLAAGRGAPVDMDNIGLRKKEYKPRVAMTQGATYSSLAIEEYARQNPTLSFTHTFPGYVKTNILPPNVWFMRILNALMAPLKMSASDCAEWQLRPLFHPAMANGAFHLGQHADPIPAEKLYLTDESRKAVYEHIMDTFAATK